MASTRVMTVKKKFVTDGVFAAELDDFLASELGSDGYSGVDIRKSLSKLEIIIKATKTQNVIGDKGARIKEIKSLIMERFPHLGPTKVELFAERIGFRGLCAVAQAESLRYKLIGGLVVRRACYGILRFIMESGAKGCEVVVSGKLRAARAKSMKFLDGFMIHSGQPKNDFIDSSTKHVHLRQGVLGIKVKIMLPSSTDGKSGPTKPLPDYVFVNEPKPIVLPDHPQVTSTQPQGEVSAQVMQKPYDPSGSTSDDNASPAAIEV